MNRVTVHGLGMVYRADTVNSSSTVRTGAITFELALGKSLSNHSCPMNWAMYSGRGVGGGGGGGGVGVRGGGGGGEGDLGGLGRGGGGVIGNTVHCS